MLDDARWPETTALIDEAVGAKGSILTFGDPGSPGNPAIFFARSYYRGVDRSAWQREYFRDYYAQDEHLPRLRALPDSRIVGVADLFSEQELKTSRMYNEMLARVDGQNGLNVRLDGPGGSQIVWGIADPVDGNAAGRRRRSTRLPVSSRTFASTCACAARSSMPGRSAGRSPGCSTTPEPASSSSAAADGSWRRATPRGRCFGGSDGLTDRDGALRAAAPADNDRLQALLARALPRFGARGASGSMMVRRSSPLPRLAVHVTPVASGETDHRSRRVAALVLIVDPVERARIDPGLVEAALGLSPAEAEIAVLLAEGRTTRQIAAATGRGYSTVRTHLKHAFHKLGVSRQFEVAQLVLALSSLPPSQD